MGISFRRSGFAALSVVLAIATPGMAQETTIIGPKGGETTTQVEREQTEDGITTERTTTLPNGDTTTTTGTISGDGEGGYTGTATRTNRQGETNTYEAEGQFNRTEGGYTNTGTVTGPNGEQATYDNTGTAAGDGSGGYTRDRTVTYPDGRTRQVDIEGTRSSEGRSGTATVTGRGGRTRSGGFQRNR